MRTLAIAGATLFWTSSALLADFSYQQTSRITGGMMAGAMKIAAAFSRQAGEPTRTTYYLKGNRLATVSQQAAEIVDLDKETITHVDFEKKTYWVMTFAEMAELLRRMESEMATAKRDQGDVSVKVSVDPTSETRSIAGINARLVRMRIEVEGKDKKTGKAQLLMTMNSEQWIAAVPGYEQVKDFYRRMMQKVTWTPSPGFLAVQGPDQARALAELRKRAAELDGLAILEITRTYAAGEQAAALRAEQPEASADEEQPSIGGALGRLGGLGRLGRLGRKKEAPQQPVQQPAAAAQQGEALLMELTSEAEGFSTAPVDPSRFDVPAGFRQVENELKRMRR